MTTTLTTTVAEALFVSDLQPSQSPSAAVLEAAADAMLQRYGSQGCAAHVAIEFGDHPETAVPRMVWAREAALSFA